MLIYHRRSVPTGEVIANALQIPHGYEWDGDLDPTGSFMIRWGSRRNPHIDEECAVVLNNADAIERASDKLLSLEVMTEAGIQTPAFSTDPDDLVDICGYPILGRSRHHARGSDIKLCLQRADYRNRKSFYTAYVPTKREFRVHVVRDQVVRIQGKYLDFPNQKLPWIRNYLTGYRFRSPRLRLRPERLQAAIGAVSAIGLDFGAVDLIIGDDNETYILEVNTAPSCSPMTGAAYVIAFGNILESYNLEINLSALDMLNPEMEDEDSDDYDDTDEAFESIEGVEEAIERV